VPARSCSEGVQAAPRSPGCSSDASLRADASAGPFGRGVLGPGLEHAAIATAAQATHRSIPAVITGTADQKWPMTVIPAESRSTVGTIAVFSVVFFGAVKNRYAPTPTAATPTKNTVGA